MDIIFKDKLMQRCQDAFNKLDPEDSILMSHHMLHRRWPAITTEEWKAFIMDEQVSEWLSIELQLYKQHQLNTLLGKVGDDSKSVGIAQMLNVLGKQISDGTGITSNKIFIYSYVPLNNSEVQAENVVKLDEDIFWKDKK